MSGSVRFLVGTMIALSGALACSSGEDHPAFSGGSGNAPIDMPIGGPCSDGATRACGKTLHERDGIATCYKGTQACVQGRWADCTGGTLSTQAVVRGGSGPGIHTLAYSTPTACVSNPCDPGCQIFDEAPIVPPESVAKDPVYEWSTGSLAGFPNGLVKKGFTQPCSTSADCQFNTYCEAPTLGTCSHAVCEPGAALDKACSSCTTAVCNADPSCCTAEVAVDTCSHDPCERGTYLKTGCNTCVDKICAKIPSCCSKSGSWTADCVKEVVNTCGNSCECRSDEVAFGGSCYYRNSSSLNWSKSQSGCTGHATDWDLIRIDNAAENTFAAGSWGSSGSSWIGITDAASESNWKWTTGTGTVWSEKSGGSLYTKFGTGEPGAEDCAQINHGTGGSAGTWYDASCSKGSGRGLCEGPQQVMKAAPAAPKLWSAACVAKVASVCGAECDPDDASASTGQCVPWYPGETTSGCSGIDLAVAAPCEGVIPVCNHGQSTAPAGLRIVHFPGNSQQYPLCNPGQTHPQMKECFTSAPIPPGECINVTGCPGLNGNREIMVNPAGSAHVAECDCGDNWSLYNDGECSEPICGGGSSEATLAKKPIDIVFIIDNSGSMAGEITEVQNRIDTDFATIIGNSGIDYRVIMFSRYGDVDVAVGGSDHPICIKKPLGGNDCLNPATESLTINAPKFYHYSADIGSYDSWCKLLGSYALPDEQPSGDRTWTARAPSGWSQWLRPGAFKVFVEISDDDVECSSYGYSFDDDVTVAGGTTAAASFDTKLRALSSEHFGTSTERNYVWHSIIGMKENSPTTTPWPASAAATTNKCASGSEGPGTGYQALSKLTGGLRYPICNNSNFDAIFNAIASDVVEKSSASCDYELPSSQDSFDATDATVSYTSVVGSADVTTTLTRVSSLAACTGTGWYYDDPSSPTKLTLCPTACNTVKADDSARVWVEFGCPKELEPVTVTQIYSSVCGYGTVPTWLDLGYNATLAGDATIVFRGRAAATQAALATATYVDLGTATAATADCPVESSCAIDVFTGLGELAKLAALELEVTLTPSSSGSSAVLNDWNLTYSCRDGQ